MCIRDRRICGYHNINDVEFDITVDDQGMGHTLVFGLDLQIARLQRPALRFGDDTEIAVRFKNGKLHVVDIVIAADAQLLEQVVDCLLYTSCHAGKNGI